MNTNHDALREALKPFAKLFHSLQADFDGPLPTAFDATISTEDVRRAAYALSQPEAAAQCWCETCRPVTLNDMRMVLCPDCGNKRCPKATHHDNACTNSNEVGQPGSSWVNVKPLSASPAAPEGANPEREIEQLIRERDQRDEIIDRLCDAVLGSERPEWSSAYGFDDAVADVEELIAELLQPSVSKAWDRFERASTAQPQAKPWGEWDAVPSVLPPEPQPQAQGEPTVGWVHGWELERANESKRWAMKECRELREAIAKRDAALDACVEALENMKKVSAAKSAMAYLRKGIGTATEDVAWLRIDPAITQANEVLGRKEGAGA